MPCVSDFCCWLFMYVMDLCLCVGSVYFMCSSSLLLLWWAGISTSQRTSTRSTWRILSHNQVHTHTHIYKCHHWITWNTGQCCRWGWCSNVRTRFQATCPTRGPGSAWTTSTKRQREAATPTWRKRSRSTTKATPHLTLHQHAPLFHLSLTHTYTHVHTHTHTQRTYTHAYIYTHTHTYTWVLCVCVHHLLPLPAAPPSRPHTLSTDMDSTVRDSPPFPFWLAFFFLSEWLLCFTFIAPLPLLFFSYLELADF